MTEPIEKFQTLLRELFQFDCADLDFGIYRIMNYKRGVIEKFITEELPKAVEEELNRGALADQSQAAKELKEVAQQIKEAMGNEALDADGNLAEAYKSTPLGKKYQDLKVKAVGGRGHDALQTSIFSHLYTFFSRYYQDGDFISKRRYSKRERYAIPYNGEEVYLYWANNDQYYVKTAEYFHDYTFTSCGVTVHFKLQTASVEQNNVKGDKRFFLPRVKEITWDEGTSLLVIPFEYRPLTGQEEITYGKKNQQDKIIKDAVTDIPKQLSPKNAGPALAALSAEKRKTAEGEIVTCLEHHLRQYTRRNTSDFFIHKDLKDFLSRELDFYLKNEVLNLDEMETAGEERADGWFQLVRVIKSIGGHIIDFLDQIECFQKMLWEKRKFITDIQYCITIGNIDESFYPDIAVCQPQWEEWKELFHIDEEKNDLFSNGINRKNRRIIFLKDHPTMVLDTKHFNAEFLDNLLSSLDDLDGKINGTLIHSENFQALNLLLEKYHEKVKCIYIDPPYNTDASPIIYKNDYKTSSWMSMMESRIRICPKLLSSTGVLVVTIDDFQQRELNFLITNVFGESNLLGIVIIRNNPSGRPAQGGFSISHEYAIFAAASTEAGIGKLERTEQQDRRYNQLDEKGPFMWELLRKRGSDSERKDSPRLYYPLYVRSNIIRIPEMVWDDSKGIWVVGEEPLKGESIVYPIDENGIERRWRWGIENARKNCSELKAEKNGQGTYTVYYKYRPPEGAFPTTTWIDSKYSATEHGTGMLKRFFREYDPFSFPKSVYAVEDCVRLAGLHETTDLCLDFFAGSGTTGHAVINLNRTDGIQRKFIMVEIGDYFETVLLPRIKKVTYSPEWKDGKPKRMATQEEAERSPRIIKYMRIESYEDALNNIVFDDASGQQALKFEDYLLKYMLKWETRTSETLLNVDKLARPFSYKLHIHANGQTREKTADIPETFNYLLGLHVQTRRVYDDNGRRYLVYRGRIDHRQIVVIWRETEGWQKADLERDKKFVTEKKLTEGADEIFVNGDSFIPNAKALEPLFKARMFAPVET